MNKHYVIFTISNGYQQDAYVINDRDHDLDWHLAEQGDESITYSIYDTEKEAIAERNRFNLSLCEKGN
jgi:hypothetical protein